MDLLTGDDDVLAETPTTRPQPTDQELQYNLEKLQAAHDGLLQELTEKKSFAERLHEQLDGLVDDNNQLRARVEAGEEENASLIEQIKDRDNEVKDLKEKESKLKQLAVKLKKELAEVKDDLTRTKSIVASQEGEEAKDQRLKAMETETERLSTLYQNSVRNFNNLQSEFDRLQDDFDCLREDKKKGENELKAALTELNKVRMSVAEVKHENDRLSKKILAMEADAEANFNRRKDLESKIIVLETELREERKRASVVTGLERTIHELRRQLDAKTTQLVELGDVADRNKSIEEECDKIKEMAALLEGQLAKLKEENEELTEANWNLTRKLESTMAGHEEDRVRLVDLMEENRTLRSKEDSFKESMSSLQSDNESRIRSLRDMLAQVESTLAFKEAEFEEYKVKVTRVLQEKSQESDNHSAQEVEELTAKVNQLEIVMSSMMTEKRDLEARLDELRSDLERTRKDLKKSEESSSATISKLTQDNDNLRSLSRDIQGQLVSQRRQHEDKVKAFEAQLEENVRTIESLRQEADKRDKIGLSPTESSTLEDVTRNEGVDTDNESLMSAPLTSITKRLSYSSNGSNGPINNVLEEILGGSWNQKEPTVNNQVNLAEETESENLLLTEQNRVLKEEIRRLERNIQRMEVAQNLEYLKNLVIKYISLPQGSSEKRQLVPVLKTLLKLDVAEEGLLIAKSIEPDSIPTSQPHGNSWSSFLSWS